MIKLITIKFVKNDDGRTVRLTPTCMIISRVDDPKKVRYTASRAAIRSIFTSRKVRIAYRDEGFLFKAYVRRKFSFKEISIGCQRFTGDQYRVIREWALGRTR